MLITDLLVLTSGFHQTCSVDRPLSYSVTFARSLVWLMKLRETDVQVFVLVNHDMADVELPEKMRSRVRLIPVGDPIKTFVLFHNEVNKDRQPKTNLYPERCALHPTVVVGTEGLRFVRVDGKLVRMKHMGNVVIGEDVEIGPYSVIHRATIDSTVLKDGVKIAAHANIGHNVIVGENTAITSHVVIAGHAEIGRDCFLGNASNIKHGVRICDLVMLGAGAVVVKDIDEPGTYAGVPARRIGAWDGRW